jgi:hypothetical protein
MEQTMATAATTEDPMASLNPYGARAQAYWQEHLPHEYEQIPEAERTVFFTELGEEIQERITMRTEELADREEPQEPIRFQARYALLNTLRQAAEQEVLAEMLPAPTETQDPADR